MSKKLADSASNDFAPLQDTGAQHSRDRSRTTTISLEPEDSELSEDIRDLVSALQGLHHGSDESRRSMSLETQEPAMPEGVRMAPLLTQDAPHSSDPSRRSAMPLETEDAASEAVRIFMAALHSSDPSRRGKMPLETEYPEMSEDVRTLVEALRDVQQSSDRSRTAGDSVSDAVRTLLTAVQGLQQSSDESRNSSMSLDEEPHMSEAMSKFLASVPDTQQDSSDDSRIITKSPKRQRSQTPDSLISFLTSLQDATQHSRMASMPHKRNLYNLASYSALETQELSPNTRPLEWDSGADVGYKCGDSGANVGYACDDAEADAEYTCPKLEEYLKNIPLSDMEGIELTKSEMERWLRYFYWDTLPIHLRIKDFDQDEHIRALQKMFLDLDFHDLTDPRSSCSSDSNYRRDEEERVQFLLNVDIEENKENRREKEEIGGRTCMKVQTSIEESGKELFGQIINIQAGAEPQVESTLSTESVAALQSTVKYFGSNTDVAVSSCSEHKYKPPAAKTTSTGAIPKAKPPDKQSSSEKQKRKGKKDIRKKNVCECNTLESDPVVEDVTNLAECPPEQSHAAVNLPREWSPSSLSSDTMSLISQDLYLTSMLQKLEIQKRALELKKKAKAKKKAAHKSTPCCLHIGTCSCHRSQAQYASIVKDSKMTIDSKHLPGISVGTQYSPKPVKEDKMTTDSKRRPGISVGTQYSPKPVKEDKMTTDSAHNTDISVGSQYLQRSVKEYKVVTDSTCISDGSVSSQYSQKSVKEYKMATHSTRTAEVSVGSQYSQKSVKEYKRATDSARTTGVSVCSQYSQKSVKEYKMATDSAHASGGPPTGPDLHIAQAECKAATKPCDAHPTLQDCLQQAHPQFISNAELRRQTIRELKKMRLEREQINKKLVASLLQGDKQPSNLPKLPPPPLAVKRIFRQQEMLDLTRKKLIHLKENVAKRNKEKQENQLRVNQCMKHLYGRAVQKKTLKKKLKHSNSVSMLTPDSSDESKED